MNTLATKLATVFHPSGIIFYDTVLPAVIMAVGSCALAVAGVISENAAFWCFWVAALVRIALTRLASFLIQGKNDGKHQG